MTTTVLVAGATGYLGRHIIAELAQHGYRIHAIVRNQTRAEAPGSFSAPALKGLVHRWVERDITTPGAADQTCANVDQVISALGVTRQPASPWDVDFHSNLAILADAERHQVQSFQYVGVMNHHLGTSLITRAKAAFIAALVRSEIPAQVLNPSGYYSDLTEVFDQARRGLVMIPPTQQVRIAPIHGRDLAAACVARLGSGPGVWDVGGPEALTFRQIAQTAFLACGRTPRIVVLPPAVITTGVWLAHRISPRVGMLAQFFVDGTATDAVGTPHGSITLDQYYRTLAAAP